VAEIADLPEETGAEVQSAPDNGFFVDALVQAVRQQVRTSIIARCGMMRVLDISQPLKLNDIYTNVNILEKISGRRRLDIADLLKVSVSDEFERLGLGPIAQERVLGLEAVNQYSKLMLLGKPGSGKTTFLKYVAIQCSSGDFQANRVPVFITLKDFAETENATCLLEYITGQFSTYGVSEPKVAERLLSQGNVLILLDGLDEVKEIDKERVLHSVRDFGAKFHGNHFVITCRIATREYTLEQFTEVEVADFDEEQIATFATKWFASIDPKKGSRFIQKLKKNNPIQELATSPLLLTLLCLVFEESADFPSNRSEIYKEGLHILLKKWDALRNIEREQVYKKLSVQHKQDLLSQIALVTFERGDYFFTQQEIEQHITNYIRNLPGVNTSLEALQLDSEAVLKSIEAQHGLLVERAFGIYSFSHLTFQEYFTAREIVGSSDPQALETALNQLVSRITDKRWREVFLLTVGMLRNADYLLQLMKQQIDAHIAQDKYLQAFLTCASQKARASAAPYKPVAVRAFYLDLVLVLALKLDPALVLALKLDPALALALTRARAHDLAHDLALDLELDAALFLGQNLALAQDLNPVYVLASTLAHAHDLAVNRQLQRSLQQLLDQLPDKDEDEARLKQWWKANGKAWVEQLRSVKIEYRNIGHHWQFSEQQRSALKQYYDANQLLVDCLSSYCYVTRAMREKIEETLLLPMTLLS
jgi:predicted NACHT family NTPase